MNRKKKTRRKMQWIALAAAAIIVVTALGVVMFRFKAHRYKVPEKAKKTSITQTQNKEPILSEEELQKEELEEILSKLTIEEKVAQMFIVTPESLTGVEVVTSAGDVTKAAINQYPVGGIIYFGQNLGNPDQVRELLANTQTYSQERIGLPMLTCVDEEGGTVSRVTVNPAFGVAAIPNMCDIGATGNPQNAYQTGTQIGSILHELGFNIDFAPVADVLTNTQNTVVQYRSFGTDCNLVTDMALALMSGLEEQNVTGVLKHFPGHGATAADTHAGYAYTDATLEEMKNNELVPFIKGIEADVDVIMVGHISCPNVTGDDTPASLSEIMVNDVLRSELGFDGVVVTDGMNMGAIAESYTSEQAAIETVQAGVDLILMPADFQSAYHGILEAVQNGNIPEERINESVRRILALKLKI